MDGPPRCVGTSVCDRRLVQAHLPSLPSCVLWRRGRLSGATLLLGCCGGWEEGVCSALPRVCAVGEGGLLTKPAVVVHRGGSPQRCWPVMRPPPLTHWAYILYHSSLLPAGYLVATLLSSPLLSFFSTSLLLPSVCVIFAVQPASESCGEGALLQKTLTVTAACLLASVSRCSSTVRN